MIANSCEGIVLNSTPAEMENGLAQVRVKKF